LNVSDGAKVGPPDNVLSAILKSVYIASVYLSENATVTNITRK